MLTSLIFFCIFGLAHCATTCPTCPTNGIWSEWTNSNTCATTCGACSTVSRTRTCLSAQIGCACTGSTTSTAPCNTVACSVVQSNSQTKACCTGTSTLIGSLYYCIAPESANTLACCPTGGYWTNWSGWSKTANKVEWKRTRQCISETSGCPCTGSADDIMNECPCLVPTSLPAGDLTCQNQADRLMSDYQNAAVKILWRPQIIVRPTRCEAYSILEGSNYINNFDWADKTGTVVTIFGNVDESGYCSVIKETGGTTASTGEMIRIYYTCNLTSLRYQTSTLTDIYKVSQYSYNP